MKKKKKLGFRLTVLKIVVVLFIFSSPVKESSFPLKQAKTLCKLRLSSVSFFFYFERFSRHYFTSVICWHCGTP